MTLSNWNLRSTASSILFGVLPSVSGLSACGAQPEAAAKFEGQGAQFGAGGSARGNVPNYMAPSGGASSSGGVPSGTAGTGGAGAGGVTVVARPISEYDPRVVFDWPESFGDGGLAKCQAGHYVGTFNCNFVPSLADGGTIPGQPAQPFPVTGPVELVLTESQNGEFLEISGGTLNGGALIAITFTGKVSGKLDCQTKQLTGMVTDGSYGIPPFPPGGYFQGPATATYSDTGPALVNGSWRFMVLNTMGATFGNCDCSWTVTYAP
jgi:hypothetical protein